MGGAEAAGDARRDASAAGTRAGLVTMNSILWGNGAIHPWIVVRSSLDDVPDALWAPRKFCSRLAIMRNMYCRFVSAGRLPDFFVDLTPDEDPFYDPPGHQVRERTAARARARADAQSSHPNRRARSQLVGVAFAYLDSANYLIEQSETTPIVDFHGRWVGSGSLPRAARRALCLATLTPIVVDGAGEWAPWTSTSSRAWATRTRRTSDRSCTRPKKRGSTTRR